VGYVKEAAEWRLVVTVSGLLLFFLFGGGGETEEDRELVV